MTCTVIKMVMNVRSLLLLCCFFVFSFMPLIAQGGGDFFFSYDGDDNPVFVQRIKWKGSAYASKYRFILKDSNDKVILDQEVKDSFIDLSLTFGKYTFRIATYNVLGKIETVGVWEQLSIKKAIIPKMARLSPSEIFLDEWLTDQFTLTGSNFEPGAKVFQCLLASKNELEVSSLSKTKITFTLPKNKTLLGSTSIRVQNPSGIYADIPLQVKNRKPVDFLFSFNYPLFFLHGNFMKTIGKSTDSEGGAFTAPKVLRVPAGIELDLILYPYKSSQGDFGIGVHTGYRYSAIYSDDPKTDPDYITIHTNLLDLQLLLYYRYSINLNYAFYLRTGAGLSFQFYRFAHKDLQLDPAQVSFNTMQANFVAGLGFQLIPVDRMVLLLGLDYFASFGRSFMGSATPYFGIGYQF